MLSKSNNTCHNNNNNYKTVVGVVLIDWLNEWYNDDSNGYYDKDKDTIHTNISITRRRRRRRENDGKDTILQFVKNNTK